MSIPASTQALRITRSITAQFNAGADQTGSAFVVTRTRLLTCAHVITNAANQRARRVIVRSPDSTQREATADRVDDAFDLASLVLDGGQDVATDANMPQPGQNVIFAGLPQGLARISVFPGMVSAVGPGLLARPRSDLIQIAGMVNNGNSGGPLLHGDTGAVIGVMTSKYVPLLSQIDTLADDLEKIPQFPTTVGIGGVNFAAFVNMTLRSMWQLAAVLRLVQVGTGWAVPAKYFNSVGV